jgi:urea transport system ATP-binding protein
MLGVQNLSFSYGMVQALRDVNMTMAQGRVTCVMGRNGVGKTTLMKNIMGLLRQNAGSVTLGDMDVTKLPANRRARAGIALVPQGRQIFPKLTIEENLRIGLEARPKGSNRRNIPEDVYELFPILATMSKRMGGDLSGGQQQQLAIARALVGNPKVLLLDEPTEGIQPNIIQQIGMVLRKLVAERGMTIVLVEQYLDFVREFGQYFYIMNRGRVVSEGETSQLTAEVVNQHLSV